MLRRLLVISKETISLAIFYYSTPRDKRGTEIVGKRLRIACERLGATFIKLGQILSMRPDFIPLAYCIELESLLDSVPAIPVSEVKKVIVGELGKPIEQIFKEFEDKPLAAASLSQIHQATLYSGEQVVVKVLRPGVKRLIRLDIKCLRSFVKIFGKFLPIGKNQAKELLKMLGVWLESETNYEIESNNMSIMSHEYIDSTNVCIPLVFKEYSTKEVLVMEYIKGYTMLELIRIKRKGQTNKLPFCIQTVLERLIEEVGIKGLLHPHYHADLHPANVIIGLDGKIYLIDFGLIQYFDERTRKNNALLMLGVAYASPELILFSCKKLGAFPLNYDERKIFATLSEICDKYKNRAAKEMSTSRLFMAIVNMGMEYEVVFPWSLILYTRSATHLDGMVLNLSPDFVFSNYARGKFLNIYKDIALREIVSIPNFIEKLDQLVEVIKRFSIPIKN